MRTLKQKSKSVLIALVPLKAQYLWNFYREMKRRDDEAYAVYEAQRTLAKVQLMQAIIDTLRRHRRQKKTISANPPQSRGVHRILDRLDTIFGKLDQRYGAHGPLRKARKVKFARPSDPLSPIIRRPGDGDDQPSSFLDRLNADAMTRGRYDLAQPYPTTAAQMHQSKADAGQSPTTPVADVLRYEVVRGSKNIGRSDLGTSAFGPLRPDTELREIIDGTGLRLDPLGRTTELVPVTSAT